MDRRNFWVYGYMVVTRHVFIVLKESGKTFIKSFMVIVMLLIPVSEGIWDLGGDACVF